MKNFSTWMLVMFMVLFWGFRVVVTLMTQMGKDLGGMSPLNAQMEIILSFIVLICLILIVKRKMLGGLIYLLGYGMYFGVNIFNYAMALIEQQTENLGVSIHMSAFISLLGIILPVAILLDLLVDKGRKANPKDKKTDWFYKNEQFDRKLDERADKNNYRTL